MAYQYYNVMYPSPAPGAAAAPQVVNPYIPYQAPAVPSYPNFGQPVVYPAGSAYPSPDGCFAPSVAAPAGAPIPGAAPVPIMGAPGPQAPQPASLVYPPVGSSPAANGGPFPQLQQYPPPPTHPLPDKQFLWGVFQRVNRDKSGNISASELQSALSNGTWKAFNPDTVRLMIGMFGHMTRNKVNFEEFCNLWKYVTDWLNYFQMFDQDCSGNIDKAELKVALMNFGYRLTDKFYKLLILKFDRDMKGAINFDDFIHCCVILQALTGAFRSHDMDQDGWVRMTYEQFLMVVFRLRL